MTRRIPAESSPADVVGAPTELTVPTQWLVEAREAVFLATLELRRVYTDRDEHWGRANELLNKIALPRLRDCLDPKNDLPF